jgi:hypothetical protein
MTTRPLPTIASLVAPALAALVGVLGVIAGPLAAPAGAHEGGAILEVEGVHPSGRSVHYIVRVTWEDDGHAAVGATVTATAVGEDGNSVTPVTLAPADDDGRYQGSVDFPEAGAWTVRFTSIDPTGTAEHAQQVAGGAATTAPGDDTAAEVDDGFAPADDGTGRSAEEAAGSSSDGMPVWLVVLAAVVALGGAVTGVALVLRHRTASDGSGARPGGPAGPGDEPS